MRFLPVNPVSRRLRTFALLSLAGLALGVGSAQSYPAQSSSKIASTVFASGTGFGAAVAVSADGSTAISGAPRGTSGPGAAVVYTLSGTTWTPQATLAGAGETGNGAFGTSVALSADGNTAIVGGSADNSGAGATWVFTRSGGVWSAQGAKMTGAGQNNTNGGANFGASVALSSDGNTAMIGASRDFSGVSNTGAAFVFTRSSGVWTQQGAKFTGSGGTAAFLFFGGSVALSADGNTAAIGGRADGNGPGANWIFTRTGTTWSQQGAKLVPSDESGSSHVGASVALSSDGNTALFGGYGDDGNVGAAWAYTRSGTTWTQQGSKLTAMDENTSGFFGTSVALSSNGNIALVGAPSDESNMGAAVMFTRSGSNWAQLGQKLVPGDETDYSSFGSSVALSADASTVVAGGPGDTGGKGATWAYLAALPTTPANLTASAYEGGYAVVYFDATAPFTSYLVTASPGGMSQTDPWGEVWFAGLTDGISYTFSVLPTNQVGTGPTAVSNAVTPGVAPAVTTTTDATPPAADPTPATTTTTAAPVDSTPDTASGTATASGSVTSDMGTTVDWPSGTFSTPVTVTATASTGLTSTLAAGTEAIQLSVTNAAGTAITQFSAPIELVFQNVPASAVIAYSHDGITWMQIPELSGTTLPAGYTDGWFRAADGVHVLTMHATDFGALAAGSKVTSSFRLTLAVARTLNLAYSHALTVHLHSTLPGKASLVLRAKGKIVATLKPVLTGKAQTVTFMLPKAARHAGPTTLTISSSAGGETTIAKVVKIALTQHLNKS